ncbi:COX15/CtaA family protein [Spongiimicrobium salis]|uniref:COX15/CtaA family protein n=1 Tax=Spongiimicrobium salis TaxID=1667022 RepID=UPI00374D1E20
MENNFLKAAKISLVLVYLVIIAGAVVRMTGSGMGCPDWPKCFGYYIPPTEASTLEWEANRSYLKGQVIILNESLWVAKSDFTTSTSYDATLWEAYTKHDYAIFNVWHTWIEYINRLFGALAGLATLALAIMSFRFFKKRKKIVLLSWLIVFAMGFQAWLGATVVYSLLAPVKITLHMVMALAIVALLLYLIHTTKTDKKLFIHDALTSNLLFLALLLTLVQIIFGTQVRQFVDHQVDLVGEHSKNLWLQKPAISFYIHRSFSVLVVALNLFLAYRIAKLNLGYGKIKWVLACIAIEVFSGILMYYVDFPFGTQPLHLILASLLFALQFYLVLEALTSKKEV